MNKVFKFRQDTARYGDIREMIIIAPTREQAVLKSKTCDWLRKDYDDPIKALEEINELFNTNKITVSEVDLNGAIDVICIDTPE